MNGQFLHSGLVTQNTTFGTFTTRVYRQYSKLTSLFFKYMKSENINRGTLSRTRDTAYSNSYRIAGIRQTFFYHFLSYGLMFGFYTFHQSNSTAKHCYITLYYTFYIFTYRKLTSFRSASEIDIRIYNRRLFNSLIDCQPLIFFVVFRMFHNGNIFKG